MEGPCHEIRVHTRPLEAADSDFKAEEALGVPPLLVECDEAFPS